MVVVVLAVIEMKMTGHPNPSRRGGQRPQASTSVQSGATASADLMQYFMESSDDSGIIPGPDRPKLRQLVLAEHDRSCPPALLERTGHCPMPPATQKRYMLKRPLQKGVTGLPLPYEIMNRLSKLQPGFRYISLEGDILLLGEKNRVVDAVTVQEALSQK